MRTARGANILSRLHELEARAPQSIVLYLEDGSQFRHPGGPFEFFAEAMKQIPREGPIVRAARCTVRAKGCGLLWQVIASLSEPKKESRKNVHRRRR